MPPDLPRTLCIIRSRKEFGALRAPHGRTNPTLYLCPGPPLLQPLGPPLNSFIEALSLLCLVPPSAPTLSCVGLSENVSGSVNVPVSWTLSGGNSADYYLINITTSAPQTPYGGLLNITGSVTQRQLTGFFIDYVYNIIVRGVNCGSQTGGESEPLTITPQGMWTCSPD